MRNFYVILIVVSVCAGLALGYGIWGKEKVKADRLEKTLKEKEVTHSRTLAESEELQARVSGLETQNNEFKDILRAIDELIGGKFERAAVVPLQDVTEAAPAPLVEPTPAPEVEAAPIIELKPVPDAVIEAEPVVEPAPAPEVEAAPIIELKPASELKIVPDATPVILDESVIKGLSLPDVESELKAHDSTEESLTLIPVPELKSAPAPEVEAGAL